MSDHEKILLITSSQTISLTTKDSEFDLYINGEKAKQELTSIQRQEFAHTEKRSTYKSFLSSHFENLVILSGAGTSVGWGGLTMRQLWDEVEKEITPEKMALLCKAIGFVEEAVDFSKIGDSHKDLEKLLSIANIAKNFVKKYNGKDVDIEDLVKRSEKVIYEKCNIEMQDNAPHEQFLNKITNRKLKDPRTKVFTLNYDTLFEQAAIRGNFTVIDGFSFSYPRTLSGRNFDYDIVYREKSRIKEEESFVPKVFHLYKPHGSVDWTLCSKTEKIVIEKGTKEPLMIYPKDSKYENSYEQPFFEMMSRFQQNLRKDNVLLICVGFSFNDKHIVTAIKEAVTQNPSFRLLIVNRTIRDEKHMQWFIDRATKQSNITIVAEEFKDFVHHYPSSKIYSEAYPLHSQSHSNEPAL